MAVGTPYSAYLLVALHSIISINQTSVLPFTIYEARTTNTTPSLIIIWKKKNKLNVITSVVVGVRHWYDFSEVSVLHTVHQPLALDRSCIFLFFYLNDDAGVKFLSCLFLQ